VDHDASVLRMAFKKLPNERIESSAGRKLFIKTTKISTVYKIAFFLFLYRRVVGKRYRRFGEICCQHHPILYVHVTVHRNKILCNKTY
jgi:hypothetical protein